MDNSNDNNSQWKKIYLDMGVNNEKELQHKLNKSTADRIFKNLKNENIDLNEIYEVICIGCYPYSESKIKSVLFEIENGLYEFIDETNFNYLENYFLVYQINTKMEQHILIEINPYEMYEVSRNLFFKVIGNKKKYDVPERNIIFIKLTSF